MELYTFAVIFALFLLVFLLVWLIRMQKMGNLNSRPVLITGCDMGLGHDLALALCKLDIPTFATCLTLSGADNLSAQAKDMPGAHHFWTLQMDVRDTVSCEKVVHFVSEKLGQNGLWAVVCNAGILGYPVVDDWLTPEIYCNVLSVNLIGTIRTCQLFKPMLLSMKGRIVFIGSMLGKFGAPSLGPYCVSKFGLEAYADINRIYRPDKLTGLGFLCTLKRSGRMILTKVKVNVETNKTKCEESLMGNSQSSNRTGQKSGGQEKARKGKRQNAKVRNQGRQAAQQAELVENTLKAGLSVAGKVASHSPRLAKKVITVVGEEMTKPSTSPSSCQPPKFQNRAARILLGKKQKK